MKDLVMLWIALIICSQDTSDAAWTLTSSQNPVIAGESFTLTCTPPANNTNSVIWAKRYSMNADPNYYSGLLANITMSMTTGRCIIADGFDTRYQYACKPGPIFQLIVPISESTFAEQHRQQWRCGSLLGGIGGYTTYYPMVYQPVTSVQIYGPNVMYKHVPQSFTCYTGYNLPRPNITLTTTGVAEGSISCGYLWETSGLTSISATQKIKASGDTEEEFVNCSAVNIPGRDPVVETSIFSVYYAPSVEPMVYGYTNLTKIYESDELTLNCQQPGGNPLSNISWECFGAPETLNSTDTISSSNVKVRIDRSMNNRTCVCSVKHPDVIVSYNKSVAVYFNVEYMDLSPTSRTVTVSSTDDIPLECNANGKPSSFQFHPWTHMIGTTVIRTLSGLSNRSNTTLELLISSFQDSGIYVCSADNSNGKHMKNNTIDVTVNSVPIVTKTGRNNIDTIYVEFYSVPKPQEIEWVKDGRIVYMSENDQQTISVVDVNITFHDVKVVTKGYRAQLLVKNPTEIDYGKYDVVINNQIGKTQHEVMYKNKTETPWITIIVVVASSLIAVIFILIVVICWKKRRRNESSGDIIENCRENTNSKDYDVPDTQEVRNEYQELGHFQQQAIESSGNINEDCRENNNSEDYDIPDTQEVHNEYQELDDFQQQATDSDGYLFVMSSMPSQS